jgi:hypothetical protein
MKYEHDPHLEKWPEKPKLKTDCKPNTTNQVVM